MISCFLVFIYFFLLLFEINQFKHNEVSLINFAFLLRPKIFFMFLPQSAPLFEYQKNLIENCNDISKAEYIVMNLGNYFRGKNCLASKWNSSFQNLIFNKKILGILNEDMSLQNKGSLIFKLMNNISCYIGINDKKVLQSIFKNSHVFSHIVHASFIKKHNSTYDQFRKRPFYIQTAISNENFNVNSNRLKYLKACMDFFGSTKIANYGRVFHNQNFINNTWLKKLPPSAFFGFAMENSLADFRITEKLFFTYRNDVIPIYRGSVKNVNIMKSYGINTKAFIDASNMSVNDLLNILNDLIYENGKIRMYEIYKQPLIPNKTFFDEKIKNLFNRVIYEIDQSKDLIST
ncbi:hypothetical protein M9Y10_017176 [Tritrichomonas musculus]|uniref:Fucosyltransferase n=1 Tax=Tritrichomonas musculus TaxID=1915356 RepID=A0ABR2HVE9_9EUKA